MKKLIATIIILVLALALLCACNPQPKPTDPKPTDPTKVGVISHDVLGSGGYGAMFSAQIDPFDQNCFAFLCDMGSIYFTYDGGKHFTRHNIVGTLYALQFDPVNSGVVWAAGSGVYKSTDHGKTMEMVFPKPDQITSGGNNYENANNWLYTDGASDYLPHYQIWSMCINRKNPNNVFVAQRVSSDGMGQKKGIYIYQTTNGQDFSLFSVQDYCYNFAIHCDESTNSLVVVTTENIYELDQQGNVAWQLDRPGCLQHVNTMAFSSAYDPNTNTNTFVFSIPNTGYDHVAMACYKTNNLRDPSTYQDLLAPLVQLSTDDLQVPLTNENKGLQSYEYYEWIQNVGYVKHQFPWTIVNMYVLNDDVVYLYHEATITKSNGVEHRTIAFLRYDATKPVNQRYQWVYGFPHKPATSEQNYAWHDADSGFCFGMCGTPQNPNALLASTITSLFYTSDCNKIYQLQSTVHGRDTLDVTGPNGEKATVPLQRTTTTGAEVICNHMVAIDPYDSNHLLVACTDIGILQSYDGGESWYHSLNEWQNGTLKSIAYAAYTNTCFDLHFDTERQGVVYGLWSHQKNAPYDPSAGFLRDPAKFGISYDGGLTWQMKNITADGNCLPYKMQVVYNGDQRTIYVATDSHGFFVTTDLGDTFTEMNDGLRTTDLSNKTAIWGNEILVCKDGIYAITGGKATDPQAQMLYKWDEKNSTFVELGLPSVQIDGKTYTCAAIRDIVYDDANNCLYLACIANVVTNYKQLVQTAGGIWRYKDGQFEQIYQNDKSVFAVNLDSSGRLYGTLLGSQIIRFDQNNTTYSTLIDGLFHRLKCVSFGATDNVLYVTTWGGGVERLILGEVE